MELRLFTEPYHGATYDELARAARHAEECGFEGFFVADHYHPMHYTDALPGPTDAWTTLAGLARETSRIRLGTLMTSATFRHPGPLAVTVAQVDAMSGGRVELGLGAGWFALDHSAYGIPFPPPAERFERMEEQLRIVTGLWATPPGQRFSYEGRHYRLTDSPALPKPVQRPAVPIIVGGRGPRRTPRLAARYADEFNLPFTSPEQSADLFAGARAARETAGGPPRSSRCASASPPAAPKPRSTPASPCCTSRPASPGGTAARPPRKDRRRTRPVRRPRGLPRVRTPARPLRPRPPGPAGGRGRASTLLRNSLEIAPQRP